jgi:hypothetical protein
VHLDRSANAEIALRTRRPPNRLFLISLLGVLAWTFGLFFVYWLRTGSWTITTPDALGTILWFGPLLVLTPLVVTVPLALIEPRGILRSDSHRKAVDLSALALELRPDLFEFVAEPSMAMRDCVRRDGHRIGSGPRVQPSMPREC